jgi:hypothetical protein
MSDATESKKKNITEDKKLRRKQSPHIILSSLSERKAVLRIVLSKNTTKFQKRDHTYHPQKKKT